MNTKVAKKNNKGFTLIELIVVIAIIAVLAAILAPQYLRYVEKSRISVDCQGAAEIMSATKTAMADTDVYESVTTFPAYVVWEDNTLSSTKKTASSASSSSTTSGDSELVAEVKKTIGSNLGRKSKALKNAIWTVTVSQADKDAATVTVNGEWTRSSKDDATKLTDGDLKKYTKQSGGVVSGGAAETK